MKNDLLHLKDHTPESILSLIDRALYFKKAVQDKTCPALLKGQVLALLFEKASTRTRVSFDVAMHHLGGHSLYLNQSISQIGRGESYADTAKVLSGYVNGIVFRTYAQSSLEEFAAAATVPVINGLSDLYHPCQVLADLVTLKELDLDLSSIKVVYVGDGNNMTHSWMIAAKALNINLVVCTPKGHEPNQDLVDFVSGSNVSYESNPQVAVNEAHVIMTDTWFSMGQDESQAKKNTFAPYQINEPLLQKAHESCRVLHCLPAHRGEEITSAVMDGKQSAIFLQAENRLYAQMGVLENLLGEQS